MECLWVTAFFAFSCVIVVQADQIRVLSEAETAFDCSGRSGIFADEKNCTKYYLCLLGHQYNYQCANGFGFDVSQYICTENGCSRSTPSPLPTDLDCDQSVVVGTTHSDDSDCDKYYACYFGFPYAFSCPWYTSYNKMSGTCDREGYRFCHEIA